MRPRVLGLLCASLSLLPGGWATAQSSVDALEAELKETQQQHDDATTQFMSGFFAQIDPAMASPDAALALFEQAGGLPPDPAPVVTEHESETQTERETRQALDAANLARLEAVLQLQCGLLHFGALFVTRPDQAGLQDAFTAWLKSAAPLYAQTGVPITPGEDSDAPQSHPKKDRDHGDGDDSGRPQLKHALPYDPADIKGKFLRDTMITKLLAFNGWGDKDQGLWSVRTIPQLYRQFVLEPLRASPSAATLAAWDDVIAMANADEKDTTRWNQIVYPPLQFGRACDDYTIAPSTEKIEGLIALIKVNQLHPQAGEWLQHVHDLLENYRSRHGGPKGAGGGATPDPGTSAAGAPTASPNVTTTVDGDMTIITTHTNSAPTNAAPAP